MEGEALGPALIARINAEHFVTTPLRPAELLFVFGGRDCVAERVSTSAQLWRDGMCRHIIVSGGITPRGERSECAVIKDGMVAAGVPADRILEEHRAMNTGENVIFSLPIIDAHIGLNNINRVICLGTLWTNRRYPMTLHRHWPQVEKMLVCVSHFSTPPALWHTNPDMAARVLREWVKIEPYRAKGFIAAWP